MSIDDDVPVHVAEAILRDEPLRPAREDTAQFKLARLLAEHDHIHSVHHQMIVAGRVLAFLPRIVSWTEAEKPSAPSTLLRQQRTATYSDEDLAIEAAHYHRQGLDEALAALAAMKSVHAPQLRDRDEDAAQEDSDRISRERADEKAATNAPRVAS